MNDERIFVAWVSDRPGVLTRVASVFFRRSINIMSLNVASTHLPRISKVVIRAAGQDHELVRVKRQIGRLIDTLRVDVLTPEAAGLDELCFVRIRLTDAQTHNNILEAVLAYHPRIVRVDRNSIVLALTSSPTTIDHFLTRLTQFDILDISRTGATCAPLAESPFGPDELRTEAHTVIELLEMNDKS